MAKPFSVKPDPAGVSSKESRKPDPQPLLPRHKPTGKPDDESSVHSEPNKWPPAESTPGDHPEPGYKPFKVRAC